MKNLTFTFNNSVEFHIVTGKSTTIREFVNFVGDVYDGKCNINLGRRPYRECDIKNKNLYQLLFV